MHNKPHTKEAKKKISLSKKGCISSCGMKGKKHSIETKKRMSAKHKKIGTKPPKSLKGENHQNWKGGYENKLMHNRRRRIMKLNAEGSHTLQEWEEVQKKQNYKCNGCGKKKKLTEDHIIPLSKGGSDFIKNIQGLCKSCNSKKHNEYE